MIADFFGFRGLEENDKEQIAKEISVLVRHINRPADIFRQNVQKLQNRKFVLPGYYFLATLISQEINGRKSILNQIIKESLSGEQKQLLDSLLEKDTAKSADDFITAEIREKGSRAKLTLLKNPSQSLKPADIKANLNDWNTLQSIYQKVSDVIAKLNLSPETLRYYANTVLKSELFQISRQKDEMRYLHLLAFIATQTFRYQDILVDSFLQTVQNITKPIKNTAKNSFGNGRRNAHNFLSV